MTWANRDDEPTGSRAGSSGVTPRRHSRAGALTLVATGLSLRLFAWGLCRDFWRNLRGQSDPTHPDAAEDSL